MLTAIPRYGARIIPNTQQTVAALQSRHQLVRGPHLDVFEQAFAERVDVRHSISTSTGRMAFYYLLRALQLPQGSEVVFPALTFWVVPELARAAGLVPVFADVDPTTFTLDPVAFERLITPRTRAVVPTHLYGLPCDMGAILDIAKRHRLAVIEDCAHALGATWRGRPVGALGDAGFFSFQLLKPLNTYGGGMAVSNDSALANRVRALVASAPWPSESDVRRRLFLGRVQRIGVIPRVFTVSVFPILWVSACLHSTRDVYMWEKIRPLSPIPPSYHQRYTNVQAALGLEGLTHLEQWTGSTIEHARALSAALDGVPIEVPRVPHDRTHVFYQYAVYTDRRDEVVRRCIREGVDVETLHVDVCTELPLFGGDHAPAPGARRAATAIQLPIYASLGAAELKRIASVVRDSVAGTAA